MDDAVEDARGVAVHTLATWPLYNEKRSMIDAQVLFEGTDAVCFGITRELRADGSRVQDDLASSAQQLAFCKIFGDCRITLASLGRQCASARAR